MKKKIYLLSFVAVAFAFLGFFVATSLAKGKKKTSNKIGIEALAKKLASSEKISQSKAKSCIKALFGHIGASLKEGKSVGIRGFGTFYITRAKAKIWKSPKTKKEFKIPARNHARFRASQKLKDSLNKK